MPKKKPTVKRVALSKNRNSIPKTKPKPKSKVEPSTEQKPAPKRKSKRVKPIDYRRSMYADKKSKSYKRQPTLLG